MVSNDAKPAIESSLGHPQSIARLASPLLHRWSLRFSGAGQKLATQRRENGVQFAQLINFGSVRASSLSAHRIHDFGL